MAAAEPPREVEPGAVAALLEAPADRPTCVLVVDDPPATHVCDLLAGWAARRLLDACSVIVVTGERETRRAALRLGAAACVAPDELDERRLRRAIEDTLDRAVALAGADPPRQSRTAALADPAAVDAGERRRSEDLTRRVLDNLFAFVGILALDGTLIEANAAPLLAAGISLEDVRGKRFWDCPWWSYSPEIAAQVREACERAVRGELIRYDVPIRVANDGRMIIDFQLAPMRDRDGVITHLIPSAVDITARALAEQRLRENEERFRLAQRVGMIGVWELAPHDDGIYWSETMWDIYGREPDPSVDRDLLFRASLHPQDQARVLAWLAALLDGDRGSSTEFRIVRSDGELRWIAATATRLVRDGGPRLIGVIIDITERKYAEQILREREERLRMAQDAAGLGIHDFDVQSQALRWDDRIRALWGFGPDEPVSYAQFMAGVHPDDRARVQAAVDRALEPGSDGVYQTEYRVISRADGRTRWAGVTGQTTFEDGLAIRLVGTAQDITERKLAEDALRRSQDQLRESDRRKDEFLAMLGHELRNPLAAIRSAAELLRLHEASDPILDRVRDVLDRQSRHMVRLVDGLLEVSRIARGKIHLEWSTVDLRGVLAAVIDDRRAQLDHAALELHVELPAEPLWLWADEVRLAQIFDNLLGNAIKFSGGPGRVHVRARRLVGDRIEVCVRDTGVGIRPDLLDAVFEPFRQDTQQLARSAGGLGIGLALVRGLVELHGGRVAVRSEGPGTGAEFEVELPAADPASPRRTPDPLAAGVGRRVLVVEDNPDAAQMLRELLALRGHEVAVASTGDDALAHLAERSVDVVFCDLGLPGMSGYEVARAIRADHRQRDTTLVALTGYGQAEDRRRSAAAGFDDHLVKPVSLRSLEGVLAQLERHATD